MLTKVKVLSWLVRFWAVVKYEMLWNIRKKKFIGALIVAFVLASVEIALPAFFAIGTDPYFAVTFSAGNLTFILFAIVTAMNSISGEFESGTIVPLLTKPVSRTMVFLGKVFAIFIVIIVSYLLLFTYTTIGGVMVYGPQVDVHLVPVALLGDLVSTFIWVAIILAAGAISKNSLLAFLMAFGLFVALSIGSGIVTVFSDNPGVLNYLPGGGASGTLNVAAGQNITIQGITMNPVTAVATGTDNIGINMVKSILFPDAIVTISKVSILPGDQTQAPQILYTESISLIAWRAVGVAFVYIFVFLFIAWFWFKRSQIYD